MKRGAGLALAGALPLGCGGGSPPALAPAPSTQPDDLRGCIRLPAAYVDPKGTRISFIADPAGKPAPGVTRELTIFPGDTAMITIPPS